MILRDLSGSAARGTFGVRAGHPAVEPSATSPDTTAALPGSVPAPRPGPGPDVSYLSSCRATSVTAVDSLGVSLRRHRSLEHRRGNH
ncbi:MAG: hypothetical protein QG608_1052 [Actinomycetota bacterium]|nr:hypothetical protein [Actinomycetota bacterium]